MDEAGAAAFTPTQATLSTISSATTLSGTAGLNAIDINGNIANLLVLSGASNAVFIVNVTGNLSLTGAEMLGLAGGVTANNVLYNFRGGSGTISSTGTSSVINGTLLAPGYSVVLSGTLSGEIIAGGSGKTMSLASGVVNSNPFSDTYTPEASSMTMVLFGLAGVITVGLLRRRRSRQAS